MTAVERLAGIQARYEAATEGPWEACMDGFEGDPHDRPVRQVGGGYLGYSPDDGVRAGFEDADAIAIAHARTDLPATVKALQGVLELHASDEPEQDDIPYCKRCVEEYPCPTVRVIEKALEEEA